MSQKKITVVNMCPHVITVFAVDKKTELVSYKPSGATLRAVSVESKITGTFDGIVPYVGPPKYGGVEGFPDGLDTRNHAIITSTIAAKALLDECDVQDRVLNATVLVPDTGPDSVVRDDKGNILGCTRFILMHI